MPPYTPPFDPSVFDQLIQHHPNRAGAILAAMRPAMLDAQARAHAVAFSVSAEQILGAWRPLIARVRSAPLVRQSYDDIEDAIYEPERLAMLDDDEARALIAALSPAQRAGQAEAQATWLGGFGYPVSAAQILAGWDTLGLR